MAVSSRPTPGAGAPAFRTGSESSGQKDPHTAHRHPGSGGGYAGGHGHGYAVGEPQGPAGGGNTDIILQQQEEINRLKRELLLERERAGRQRDASASVNTNATAITTASAASSSLPASPRSPRIRATAPATQTLHAAVAACAADRSESAATATTGAGTAATGVAAAAVFDAAGRDLPHRSVTAASSYVSSGRSQGGSAVTASGRLALPGAGRATAGGADGGTRCVRELEDAIALCRRQLHSKHETIATVTEAIASAREEQKMLTEEVNLVKARREAARARQQQPGSQPTRGAAGGGSSSSAAAAALHTAIDAESQRRRAAEDALDALLAQQHDVHAALAEEKQKLLAEIDAHHGDEPTAAPSDAQLAAFFDADFESQLNIEKKKMLSTLQETKDALLDDFSVMRTRLRARINMLERSAESKQKSLEELYLSASELEQRFTTVKDNNQRLYEQFRGRLDAQHDQLTMAKTREAKARQQLKAKDAELEDLKLMLHVELSNSRAGR